MPLIARIHVKCAFLWLLLAAGLHVLPFLGRFVPVLQPTSLLAPSLLHLYLVGWVSQLIFGVSYWMFPRYSRERPHFSEVLATLCLVLVNFGLALRLVSEPLAALTEDPDGWDLLMVLSGGIQWLGILAYVVNTWPRVRRRPDAR